MEKEQHMQAIAITAFGGPDRLTLMDLPVPVSGLDQVVIKIQAAGVGMWDVKVRQGRVRLEGQQFPLVLGWESAGTIEQVGAKVTGLSVGAHVIVTANSRNHPYLQKLGASELIDYAQTDFADAIHAAHPEGIDAVLDSVGGETAAKSLNVVRDGGRLVTIVDLEQVRPTRHIDTHLFYFRPDGQQLAELTKLVDTGQL